MRHWLQCMRELFDPQPLDWVVCVSMWISTIVLACFFPASLALAVAIDENCTATVLNRTTAVAPNGTFALGNVPATPVAFRVRILCDPDPNTDDPDASLSYEIRSDFMVAVPNGETKFVNLQIANPNENPISPFGVICRFTKSELNGQ